MTNSKDILVKVVIGAQKVILCTLFIYININV